MSAGSEAQTPVTLVCATCNAPESVELTFASLLRHTPEPFRLVVADNSDDDTVAQVLSRWPRIRVISLAERVAIAAREARWEAAVEARLAERVACRGATEVPAVRHPTHERSRRALAEHGATLDWLVARVTTPFVLTLDSDVEFRETGWLTDMLRLATSGDAAAVGIYEPGQFGYQPRLAPYVLLLRTDVIHRLGATFRGGSVTTDAEEARRWHARTRGFELDLAELQAYPTTKVYPTAAVLFEQLTNAGERWLDLPPGVAGKFHHFGHMSWGERSDAEGGSERGRGYRAERLLEVQTALAWYRAGRV